MTAALVGLMLAGAATPIVVEGATECPTADEVAHRLEHVLPAGATGDRAVLHAEDAGVRVALWSADGTLVGERLLGRTGACADMAAAAALALAAWRSDVHPEYLAAAPALAARLPAATATAFEVGAAGGFVVARGPGAPGGLVEATWGQHRAGLAAHAGVLLTAARDQALPAGSASWSRLPALLGVRLRSPLGGWRLDATGDLAVARLRARGRGFDANQTSGGWDFAGVLGLRLGRSFGVATPWVGASAWAWPLAQRVYELPGAEARTLPRLELLAAAGLTVCLCRPGL